MQQFMRKFEQLNGKMAKVILNHCLFGKQVFYCDNLQTISDDKRIGVILKDQAKYVDKQNIMVMKFEKDICEIADDRLTITINVNK